MWCNGNAAIIALPLPPRGGKSPPRESMSGADMVEVIVPKKTHEALSLQDVGAQKVEILPLPAIGGDSATSEGTAESKFGRRDNKSRWKGSLNFCYFRQLTPQRV